MGHFGLAWCFSVDFAPLVLHLSLICISDFFTLLLHFPDLLGFARDQVLDFHYQAIPTLASYTLNIPITDGEVIEEKAIHRPFCGVHHDQILHIGGGPNDGNRKKKPKKKFKTQNTHPMCLVRARITD
jgi:hypothetical protein